MLTYGSEILAMKVENLLNLESGEEGAYDDDIILYIFAPRPDYHNMIILKTSIFSMLS